MICNYYFVDRELMYAVLGAKRMEGTIGGGKWWPLASRDYRPGPARQHAQHERARETESLSVLCEYH